CARLERLPGERSFTLTYGERGRLEAIELKGGPQAAPPPDPEKPPTGGLSERERWGGVAHVLAVPKVIRVSGALARALGAKQVHFVDLMQAAAEKCPDRACRRQAWHAGLRALERDEDLRGTFLAAIDLMNEAELTGFARTVAAQT